MMPTNVRVRAKDNCQIITSRVSGTGKPVRPLPGEWFELHARELGNIAIAAQVETEEQAATSDAARAAAAATPEQGAPRVDPEFMQQRKMYRTQAENSVAEAGAVATKRLKETEGPPPAPAAKPKGKGKG